MSVAVILRAAPVATAAELMEPKAVSHHEMYGPDALRPRPGLDLRDIPIRVDHIKDAEPIGRVTALRTDDCWTGGTWLWIHAEIDDPPGWLRKGTPVSIGRSAFDTRRPLGAEWELVSKAFLTEASVLSPGVESAFPRACVEWIGDPVTRASSEPAGEVIPLKPVPVRRARDPDSELLDWWRAAPDGLDEETWERLLAVLQTRRSGPSIHDYYREHLAAAR